MQWHRRTALFLGSRGGGFVEGCLVGATRSQTRIRRGGDKNAILRPHQRCETRGGGTSISLLFTPPLLMLMNPRAGSLGTLNLEGGEEGRSIIELNLRSDRDRDVALPLTFPREYSGEIVALRKNRKLKKLSINYIQNS